MSIQEDFGVGAALSCGEPTTKLRRSHPSPRRRATAIVYCEANFGSADGKTANGLVRHSQKYEIVSVIDSEKAGQDAGTALGASACGIPVCPNLAAAIARVGAVPDYFIFGIAPSSGRMSSHERQVVVQAMRLGISIVSGLHEFLNDDAELVVVRRAMNVEMLDLRRPRAQKDLRTFSGRIAQVNCPRIAVLGTDCAIGKRTTATILTEALNANGLRSVMVGTGQTGLMQGARYGVSLDAVPSQFCAGEMEAAVVEAFETERPQVIVIEGQGALSHPAYSTSSFILRGSCPQAVVLQHAPSRVHRCDFVQMSMPTPADEIRLIEAFSNTRVIGVTINHEGMTDAEVRAVARRYESELGLPAADALKCPPGHLVAMVRAAFPELVPQPTLAA